MSLWEGTTQSSSGSRCKVRRLGRSAKTATLSLQPCSGQCKAPVTRGIRACCINFQGRHQVAVRWWSNWPQLTPMVRRMRLSTSSA